MNPTRTATYREIISQPEAWEQALGITQAQAPALLRAWQTGGQRRAIFTGCGSTHYLAVAVAALFQQLTGVPAQPVPGGELWLNPRAAYLPGEQVLLVAFSRSGATSETIAAVRRFQESAHGPVIVITNYGESRLAALGDLSLVIPKGQERSVAQTRSFASLYVAGVALTLIIAGRGEWLSAMAALPGLGEDLIRRSETTAEQVGLNLALDRFYFLGSGPRYGLACEVNLKMKEMTLTHSEPFQFLEFRHGPMSMVTNTTQLVGLLSDANRAHEAAVLGEMKALGGTILSLGEADADVSFASGLPGPVRNVLYLPPLQLMALYRALAKGLDPDRPANLSAVVELDTEQGIGH